MSSHNFGYMDASGLATTASSQLELTDASIKRLMAAGFTQGVPNVARLTGVNVAKRTLAPTRMVSVQYRVIPGGDFVGGADIAIGLLGGFPFQVFSNQVAADREETEGDYIAGIQLDLSVVAQRDSIAGAAGTATSTLSDDLEQAFGEYYGLAIFPSSGNQSPLVANTSLREFAQTHRLAGPDGFRGIPPVRWSDNFAHIDLLQAVNPVATGARPIILNPAGNGDVEVTLTMAVRLRTFTG